MNGRVLVVAGSDSGGGAGIQADIKTITALGGFASSAISALTAQNTSTITAFHMVPPEFVAEQMRVVISDIGVDCIKTGMLHNKAIISEVALLINNHAPDSPLVVDPVMVAKSGDALLEDTACEALKSLILPISSILTPNIPEAEVLSGTKIKTLSDMKDSCEILMTTGPKAVLLKGGHLEGNDLFDVLMCDEGEFVYQSERIESTNTHGTGCTLASAIAVGIANGLSIPDAVCQGRSYVRNAILYAPGFGFGNGPLNHGFSFSHKN